MELTPDSADDVLERELTETEYRAFQQIRIAGIFYQSELWKALDVASRTGTRVARSLADKGLIERNKSTHNGTSTFALTIAQSPDNTTSTGNDEESGPHSQPSETLPPPAEAVFGTVVQDGELPIRHIIRRIDESQQTVEDAIEILLERDLVEIERQRLYGRDSVLVSPSKPV